MINGVVFSVLDSVLVRMKNRTFQGARSINCFTDLICIERSRVARRACDEQQKIVSLNLFYFILFSI